MTTQNTDNLVSVSVNNVIPSGAGFGVVIGTGSSCIIPSRVMYAADLEPGDLIKCRIIDNPAEEFRHRTPYMVAYVDPNGTAALRILVAGGTSVHAAAAASSEQLSLPLEEPKSADSKLLQALADWDDDEVVVPEPKPEPPVYTAARLKEMVSDILDTGGLMTFGDLRDAIWPDEEFGSDDPRYKTLVNAVRDLHNSAAITAFGRRSSAKGNLACIQYTKFPEYVAVVWSRPEAAQ